MESVRIGGLATLGAACQSGTAAVTCAGGCAISQAWVLNGAINEHIGTPTMQRNSQIKSAKAVVAMSSLPWQARTAPPRHQTRMSAWTGSQAIGEICLAQRGPWSQRRRTDAAPRFVVLQLDCLVTPHSPANHANSAAWCSRTRRERWRGSRSSDSRSEAKRLLPSTWTVSTLDSSHVGTGHWASPALAGPSCSGRAPPKQEEEMDDGLRMTALVLRSRECLSHALSAEEQRGHQLTV